MHKEYIWHNKSGGVKHTKDPEGKLPIKEELPCGVSTYYKYYGGTDILMSVKSFKSGRLHRVEDRPAVVCYNRDGSVESKRYYKDGYLHRDGDKPAFANYNGDGGVEYEVHYKDGKRHREGDKPARVWYNKDGSVKYGILQKWY